MGAASAVEYEMVVGLEVHVQLKTRTKLFCGCATGFGAPPNAQVCPVCLGLPGVLPVLNREAFDLALRAALALNGEIASFTKFDRKHYYYPDLPKNYQISQYDLPFSRGGHVVFDLDRREKMVGIHRVHLEEDAGKLLHAEARGGDGGSGGDASSHTGYVPPLSDGSLVDLNRTGVPLLEIVSEPDLRTSEEAHAYLTTLKQIMQYIGVSDCDMEKGSLRCDANISVRPQGERNLGVKTEIKNLNSFRFLAKALDFEARRQIGVLSGGDAVSQETLLWDPEAEETRTMRSKEEAHDYRYFPEPDLAPVAVSPEWLARARAALPELPRARQRRFVERHGLPAYDAGVLTQSRDLADYFEACVRLLPRAKILSNWIMSEVSKEMNERKLAIGELGVPPERLVELIGLVERGTLTGRAAKDVFVEMVGTKRPADAIVKEKGLTAVSDAGEIKALCRAAIEAHPGPVADYRGGKKTTLQFLVGQVMKASRGKANPKAVQETLAGLLG